MYVTLTPHGGSGNHGCEAIMRSTAKILDQHKLTLFSANPEEDITFGIDKICKLKSERGKISRFSLGYLEAKLKKNNELLDCLAFAPLLKSAKKADLVLSIGGDNYCYGINNHILLQNRAIRKGGTPMVLWGCSIEPSAIADPILQEDLKLFKAIIARESITYSNLAQAGISQVFLTPDPAFVMERIDLPLPKGFVEGNTIGINVSPMIIAHEHNKGITLENYVSLIRHIIETTDMQIALIPHVVWHHNDDRIPLQLLYEQFKDSGRVIMIEDHNAMELKGFIARCRFFVAARTHASIAAYSQSVPTLVVGYSVKARGIAKDIFGTEKNYVIPVQNLQTTSELTNAFQWLFENENSIRKHYISMMEEYKQRVWSMKNILNELL